MPPRRRARWVAVWGLAAAFGPPTPGRAAEEAPPDAATARMEQARRTADAPLRWIIESGTSPAGAARATPGPAPVPTSPRPAAPRPRPVAKVDAPAATRVDADEATASATIVVLMPPSAPAIAVADAVMATVPLRAPVSSPPLAKGEPKLVLKRSTQPDLRISDCLLSGCSATVTVSYTVESDGSVSHPRLLRPSANARLNESVLSAISQWRYEPIDHPVEHQTALRLARD